jgi:A118 family predicted phage portal protein
MRKGPGHENRNRDFRDARGSLTPRKLPEGVAGRVYLPADIPMFAVLTPNLVNNVSPGCGLGMSVYANAIDNLKGIDLAFNNFCRDFKLGGKKVFLNKVLTQRDEYGRVLTPDDVAQQLFTTIGESEFDDAKSMIQEFNPSLRVAENKDGVQAQLDYFSFKAGFGTKHYQFDGGRANAQVTATEYMGDKQELVQHAAKHCIHVERFLRDIVRAILWAGREICGAQTDPETQMAVNFEDGYLIDSETERARDMQEVSAGLMQPWEYRVRWRGEDEATAKQMTDPGGLTFEGEE